MHPKDAKGLGAVWSGSTLFAQAYLSENLGSLRYVQSQTPWKPLMLEKQICIYTL